MRTTTCPSVVEPFAAFFGRATNAERNGDKKPGYPRFKPYSRFRQVRFVNGDGAKWIPADSGGWAHATFQAVGSVKVRQHRQTRGTVKALQLKQDHRRWYVIVIAETEPVPLPATRREIGVDMGVARFLTTSDGQIVDNPRLANPAPRAGIWRRSGDGFVEAAHIGEPEIADLVAQVG